MLLQIYEAADDDKRVDDDKRDDDDALTNLALSRAPAMMPAMNAAQLSCPMSAGTDTKAFVTGAFS